MSGPRPSALEVYADRCEVLAAGLDGELARVDREIAALQADIEAHGRFTAGGRELRPAVDLLARFIGHRLDGLGQLRRLHREIGEVRAALDGGRRWPRLVEAD